jgi:hypothetical protein
MRENERIPAIERRTRLSNRPSLVLMPAPEKKSQLPVSDPRNVGSKTRMALAPD